MFNNASFILFTHLYVLYYRVPFRRSMKLDTSYRFIRVGVGLSRGACRGETTCRRTRQLQTMNEPLD